MLNQETDHITASVLVLKEQAFSNCVLPNWYEQKSKSKLKIQDFVTNALLVLCHVYKV